MSTDNEPVTGDVREAFAVFVALHAGALQASGIPPVLWRSLHRKITGEVGPRRYGPTGDFRSSCARERALLTCKEVSALMYAIT
ncbi:hypothetical protein EYF80_067953 [Liparis tanakae]|uniref:Uncharacterized protein n=1 Tax=Liparis tanakae TaxID=230148 RepID=A0A4Z2DZI5_9TELE|nr:hypothetical protein EYF80_067953 [Liparis tanakae]